MDNQHFYLGLNILNKNDKFDQIFKTVYICAYNINTKTDKPFIQYLLYKNDTLNFPSFTYTVNSNIINDTITLLSFLFKTILIQNEYKGYLNIDDDLYLFFDISKEPLIYNISDTYRKNKLWMTLIDEMVNYNSIFNFPIEKIVSNLFYKNNELLFLYDKNSVPYETPIVAFSGQHESLLNFTFVFGVSCLDNNEDKDWYKASKGNYSFTDYTHSIQNGGWSKTNAPEIKYGKLITDNQYGRYIKGGIIRFALFLGKNEIISNTLLVTSNWTDNFDSIYYDRLGTPTWIVKTLEQQCPLSYHYIDKKSLSNKFNPNDVYFIL